MSNKVDKDVALEIACHEAMVRQAYKDSGGVWTWSVGLTNATGHFVERYINNPQPLQHCLNVYVWALENYAEHVREVFEGETLSKAQFTAILSFTWNLGQGNLRRASWVKLWKAGRMQEAERSFLTWNKAAGATLTGLVRRRKAEADLLFRGKWSNDGTMVEYTRVSSYGAIDWGSAKTISVSKELARAFDLETPVVEDHKPNPKAKPSAPTTTPTTVPRRSIWEILISLAFRLFGVQ